MCCLGELLGSLTKYFFRHWFGSLQRSMRAGHRKALDQRLKSFLGPFVLCGLRWVVNMPQPLPLVCYVNNWKFLFQMFNQMVQDYDNLWKHLCPLLILRTKTHSSYKQPACVHCSPDAGPDCQGSILLPPTTYSGHN